jgi:ferrous iron transport protein A
MFEGQRVTVVRRGVFGGPLHVRTGSGGEFAIDARLALSIQVERSADGEPK